MNQQTITIVSGLPRSGTSLMMKMLEAGGMDILSDNIRAADADNPGGYYEYERVKKIKEDPVFLENARGKAVKIISELLLHVPPRYPANVIFMRRSMEEVLASQRTMLARRGKPVDGIDEQTLAALFQKHIQQVESWIARQSHIQVLYISYNDLLEYPTSHIERITEFLPSPLDMQAMAHKIDQSLYRQRSKQERLS